MQNAKACEESGCAYVSEVSEVSKEAGPLIYLFKLVSERDRQGCAS